MAQRSKYMYRIATSPRLKMDGGSGYARYISFEQIALNEVRNPIIINQHYCQKAVQVSNVAFRQVQGSSASKIAINLGCSTNVGCTNITLEHVHINGEGLFASCTNAHGTAVDTSPQVTCLSSN
ncbi:hypothetical protein LguiA_033046 [Lonicera macranthoides]